MLSNQLRMTIIRALAGDPLPHLQKLRRASDRDLERLLLWLDESGLALYLLRRIEQCDVLDCLPVQLQQGLLSRQELNRGRVAEMLREFARVNDALRSAGVRYAFLKGFSLVPDFCPDVDIRHHNDIDVVIHPESLPAAVETVRACGYRLAYTQPSGEQRFCLPLPRLGTAMRDIYHAPDVGILELHLTMCESPERIPFRLPDPFDCLETQQLREITFPALSKQDKFSVQTLHIFRHLTLMWIRASWLYETAHFLRTNQEAQWWDSFCDRAGSNESLRNVFGVTLGLVGSLFQVSISTPLRAWCIDDLPSSLRSWADSVGVRWTLSDPSFNRSPILVEGQFLSSRRARRQYLRRRLIPVEGFLNATRTVSYPNPLRPSGPQPSRVLPQLFRRCIMYGRAVLGLGRDVLAMSLAARKIRGNEPQSLVSLGGVSPMVATPNRIDGNTPGTTGTRSPVA